MRALTTAATGMKAQELNLDVIAHNLANVNTAGFKKSEVNFEDLLYVDVRAPGAVSSDGTEAPAGFQIGSGSAAASTIKLHSQGTIAQTQSSLDVAIDGEGYFEVQPAGGGRPLYTRAGNFHRDSEGQIVTGEGYPLSTPISIPADADQIQIGHDGTVSYRDSTTGDIQNAGQFQTVRFMNPAGLMAVGGNLFEDSDASGEAIAGTPGTDGMGTLKAGYLERSNVDVVSELIKMIMAQRAYEVNSRTVKAGDEMMSLASRLGRA